MRGRTNTQTNHSSTEQTLTISWSSSPVSSDSNQWNCWIAKLFFRSCYVGCLYNSISAAGMRFWKKSPSCPRLQRRGVESLCTSWVPPSGTELADASQGSTQGTLATGECSVRAGRLELGQTKTSWNADRHQVHSLNGFALQIYSSRVALLTNVDIGSATELCFRRLSCVESLCQWDFMDIFGCITSCHLFIFVFR